MAQVGKSTVKLPDPETRVVRYGHGDRYIMWIVTNKLTFREHLERTRCHSIDIDGDNYRTRATIGKLDKCSSPTQRQPNRQGQSSSQR
ncbi:hypothetical protein N7490_011732 [Penicillium lividum]|nr:hypothetical protein N7490_011732 [Penicillium lividum]